MLRHVLVAVFYVVEAAESAEEAEPRRPSMSGDNNVFAGYLHYFFDQLRRGHVQCGSAVNAEVAVFC